ncbi:MAG: ATP-dependent zinc metalloprotease FtsH [Myxococcota bacterium]
MTTMHRAGVFWLILLFALVLGSIMYSTQGNVGRSVPYSDFVTQMRSGDVAEVTIRGQEIHFVTNDDKQFVATGPMDQRLLLSQLDGENEIMVSHEEMEDQSLLWLTVSTLVPLIVMVGLFYFVMRNVQGNNGRAMQFGKSRAKLNADPSRRVTFEDVAGIDEVKEECEEIIDFLKDPRKFTRLGGRIPKGVLLMGPPGTGKTLIARAVAGEAGVPFFSISGSDFVEMFVGVGASRVRDLFEQGKKQAPCIIFIDEIDAVGRQRGAGLGGGHDEREQTLNQLLVEMDGFEGTEGVIMIAATNRPDVLDPALLRPGRFDRRISVPNPDIKGRNRILQIHTRRIPLGENVELDIIAKGTPGFSGADLENLCNEAALLAARRNKKQVDMSDMLEAREKILMGPERRSLVLPEQEKRCTAYHEAGHALVAHLLPGHDPVLKVTIIPRGRALGVTMTLPSEDRLSMTREGMYKRMSMMMGGRAAEEVALQSVTGGASNDIAQATRMARQMICELGMSDALGPVSWGGRDNEPFLGRSWGQTASHSDQTSKHIDDEVKQLLERSYDAARRILTHNIHVLHKIAQSLIEHESLDQAEFAALVDASDAELPEGLAWMGV